MKTMHCLLDISNTMEIDSISISKRIADKGKDNLWADRLGSTIDTIVIHYISAVNLVKTRRFEVGLVVQIFCDYSVSSHYLIARNGTTYTLVPENKKAWHCGGSIMPPPDDRQGVNDFSIGIELVATHESGFTKKQYLALARLRKDIEKRYMKTMTCVGHEDIAGKTAVKLGLRQEIKTDPGPLFNWDLFNALSQRKQLTAKRYL